MPDHPDHLRGHHSHQAVALDFRTNEDISLCHRPTKGPQNDRTRAGDAPQTITGEDHAKAGGHSGHLLNRPSLVSIQMCETAGLVFSSVLQIPAKVKV
jgi:hypothetical protein